MGLHGMLQGKLYLTYKHCIVLLITAKRQHMFRQLNTGVCYALEVRESNIFKCDLEQSAF
jgi:hypothetical protein